MPPGKWHAFLQASGLLTMDSAGVLQNILSQVKKTTIDTGHVKGHFISQAQFSAIENALNAKSTIYTPGTSKVGDWLSEVPTDWETQYDEGLVTPDQVRGRRELVKKQISKLRARMIQAPTSERSGINEQINQLISERAKLDKILAVL